MNYIIYSLFKPKALSTRHASKLQLSLQGRLALFSDAQQIFNFTMLKGVLSLLLLGLVLAGYQTSKAKQLANYAAIAYESVDKLNAWSCALCARYPLTNSQAFTQKDIQGFTGFSDNLQAIIVSFRGSDNLENWIKNLELEKSDYSKCSKCKVHDGFYKDNNLTLSIVRGRVQQLREKYKKAPIHVTGHSLGAALSVITALQLKREFEKVAEIYNIGQPRVGNRQFADYISKELEIYRIIHYADIVPHLMPLHSGYIHGGLEMWYDKEMKDFQQCEAESHTCSNSLKFYNAGDHSSDIYIKLPADTVERNQLNLNVVSQ